MKLYVLLFLPIKIIYTETFDTQRAAMQREIEVKKWNRLEKENLIKNNCGKDE